MTTDNNQNPIEKNHVDGVYCDVTNCVYHDGKQHCHAGSIQVGPTFAVSSADTVCATFQAN